MSGDEDREAIERSVRSCYSTWSLDYYKDYYLSPEAYPPVHLGIVRDELSAAQAETVIDAGCGPASMLRDLGGLGLRRYGFDLTPEMALEARRVLQAQGVPSDHIWVGSVLDDGAFRRPKEGYDAAICFGVLPHIATASDAVVLANLTATVRDGGLVLLEARNQLFGMFTLNRYSRDLFRQSLIDEPTLRAAAGKNGAAAVNAALAAIDAQFRLDLPPVRQGKTGEPGYDEVLSRTHNPFELSAAAQAAGLRGVEILFYHYHALPPLAASHVPDLFRSRSLAMENPRDWRGYIMASAFILKGYKGPSVGGL